MYLTLPSSWPWHSMLWVSKVINAKRDLQRDTNPNDAKYFDVLDLNTAFIYVSQAIRFDEMQGYGRLLHLNSATE